MIREQGSIPSWRLTRHAREAARRRGFEIGDVLRAATEPSTSYPSEQYGEGRYVHIRGDIAVPVHRDSLTVITVLWRKDAPWDDEEVRCRSRAS